MDFNPTERDMLIHALETLMGETIDQHGWVLARLGENDEDLRKQFEEQFALYKKLGGTRVFSFRA